MFFYFIFILEVFTHRPDSASATFNNNASFAFFASFAFAFCPFVEIVGDIVASSVVEIVDAVGV